MTKKIIHVNRHFIVANKKGANKPVYTIKEKGKTIYARNVKILGPSEMVYSDKPLSCGAVAWIETYSDIELEDQMTFKQAKEL